MQDNAPSHASKYSTVWLASKGLKDHRIMTWPKLTFPLLNIQRVEKERESKDREKKMADGHVFIPVSPSPSTTCQQCTKLLSTKEVPLLLCGFLFLLLSSCCEVKYPP
uniref:Uncharacterized protein n=1 Tax=Myripristis murdjan TaxID=586833 RepID=A0A667WIM0_9TELE